jgi:methylenetetrahydrofolate--tRNA-(uracil-5-)-methyltransferase
MPRLRFAGQITGCEGYVESAAIGLLAAASPPPSGSASEIAPPPPTTAFGALLGHITGGHVGRRAGPALVPADERQFRPVPADRVGSARIRPVTA